MSEKKIKDANITLCDNFCSNKEYKKKRCFDCKYYNQEKEICESKDSNAIIREVIEYKDIEETKNYMCNEQKMCCFKCTYLCKDKEDIYCDFGKFGIGKAKREKIQWKEIKDSKASTCDSFYSENPLDVEEYSFRYCDNCFYYYSDNGCIKNGGEKFRKIKWTKIEDAPFNGCKSFEKSFETKRTVTTLSVDINNCYNCKFYNTEMGCMNGKKPKSIIKEIDKPAYHVCKVYSPSWLRKQDYKNSCATCKFLIQGKGCANVGRKSLKDLKRIH